MSTTEQQPVVDVPEIEAPPVAVRFASKGVHLVLTRVQSRTQLDGAGNKFFTQPVEYEFQDGFLNIYPGQDTLRDKFDPATGEFSEQDALEWLRSHFFYGREDGFWEVSAIAPDPQPILTAVMKLAVQAGNPDTRDDAEERLVELHERERETWKRQGVLDACRVALSAIESSRIPPELEQPGEGEPGGASRHRPEPPPPPSPEMIAAGAPRKPGDLNLSAAPRPFAPDSAPVRED